MGFVNYNSNGEKTSDTNKVDTIKYFATSTGVEDGYLDCNGQAVSRTTYSSLFAKIGTAFGVGDGSTTFNVSDFRAASAVGVGTSTKGAQNETITFGQWDDDKFQSHKHTLTAPASYDDYTGGSSNSARISSIQETISIVTDGTNGTPRTGNVTHGKRLGIYIGIKY